MHRLNTLVRKLRRTDMLDEFYAVIREQLEEGVVERAPAEVTGREFYDNVACTTHLYVHKKKPRR